MTSGSRAMVKNIKKSWDGADPAFVGIVYCEDRSADHGEGK